MMNNTTKNILEIQKNINDNLLDSILYYIENNNIDINDIKDDILNDTVFLERLKEECMNKNLLKDKKEDTNLNIGDLFK